MEPYKEYTIFGRQVGYVIGANVVLLLLGFIRLPILTKGLGANLYGTWSLINVTISLLVPFALIGLGVSIVRFLAAEKDRGKIREDFLSACSVVFILGTAFSILLFFLSDYLASFILGDITLSSYIKLASVLILLNSIDILSFHFFQAFRRIGLYAIITTIQNALQIGLIVLSILLGYKLTGVITAVIVSGILFNLINLFIILRQTGLQLPHFSNLKSYLKWGLPLTPTPAILWIINTSDRYMVSYFIGVTTTGIYHAAYTIGYYASFTLIPLGIVLFPTITKSYDGKNLGETRNYLKYSLKYFMMLAIPSAFGLSILAKPLLHILTTPEFVVGSTVIPFVAFGAVMFGLYQITVFVIQLVNKNELLIGLLGASAALNIILNIILIPRLGIIGAAIATLIAYGVLGMLTLMLTRRYLKFDLSIPFMLKSVSSSVIMTLCIWLISPQSLVSVITSILASVLIYFGVLLLTKGLSKEELAFFTNFLKDNLRKIRMVK